MKKLSYTVRDLLSAADAGSTERSAGCTPNLIKFDEEKGSLDFVTRCPRSKNSWYQRAMLEDFDIILALLEEGGELEEMVEEEIPEEENEILEEMVEETVEEKVPVEETETEEKGASLNIRALEWSQLKSQVPEVLESDIKVACSCPAFVYYYANIADSLGVGETSLIRYKNAPVPEGRSPDIRNPNLEGVICKHLVAVLKRFF